MTPKKTGTKPGQTGPGKTPGIRYRSEPRYHLTPWQLRLYHSGGETYSFHKTEQEAIAAKKKSDRLARKEGTRALGYNRAAQLEYEEAKRILGPEVNLIEMARNAAARAVSGQKSIKLAAAVKEYVAGKISLRRSRKHVQDLRQRLTRFSAAFPNRDVDTITRNEIVNFLGGLRLDATTVWNFYGIIASFFHHAVRADWRESNPCEKIDLKADMPEKRKGPVEILTLRQGAAVMRQIEQHEPDFIAWACIQYFLGIRDAEAERFHGEWIQPKSRKVVIPGWVLDGDAAAPAAKAVTKTRDDWVLDDVPPAFWIWVKRYHKAFSAGPIPYPSFRSWGRIRDPLIAANVFTHWPHNGFRHSFATYHLSWLRSADKTSFMLRHRNPQELWENYFAKFVDPPIGRRYLSLRPR
jgi:hypothetical protein